MAKSKLEELRDLCEADLFSFAKYVNETRIYGDIHKKVFRFLQNEEDQLIMLPRGHQKSHCMAVYCAWKITKRPDITILYTSATEELAILQLSAIKDILTQDNYRKLWPNMVNLEEGRREQWAMKAFKVDHEARKRFGVRDSTVSVGSVTSNTAGRHCDLLVFDDLVVPENAYTEEGRRTVAAAASQLESVKNPGAITKAIGTRYHPSDLYNALQGMLVEEFGENGEELSKVSVYRVMQFPVKDETGTFLWPRTQHPRTKRWEGFDDKILARKKAEYITLGEATQFYAQYYNDPNDPDSERLSRTEFEYYEIRHLIHKGGRWFFKNKALNIFAAADLAFTLSTHSDYTAIVVIGVDSDGFIYVLDVDRFKTNQYEEYYRRIEELHAKWGFKKLRIETNAGANVIAEYIKDRARQNGMSLAVDGKPAPRSPSKEERIAAVLEPRYTNKTILHYKGGLIPSLEEELVLERPTKDDMKDALAAAVTISAVPGKMFNDGFNDFDHPKVVYHNRFGGIVR